MIVSSAWHSVNGAIPAGERLTLFDPAYQPAIFYLRTPYSYANAIREIPAAARCILARAGNRQKLESERPEFDLAQDFGGSGKNQLLLYWRRE